jgi:hypothetical protein
LLKISTVASRLVQYESFAVIFLSLLEYFLICFLRLKEIYLQRAKLALSKRSKQQPLTEKDFKRWGDEFNQEQVRSKLFSTKLNFFLG